MSPAKFRRLGYLQELNRVFLHPLGLALEVIVGDNGEESFGQVWDYRQDPEGILFAPEDLSHPEFAARAARIKSETEEAWDRRQAALGFYIQPIQTGEGEP
ncbi:MAG: hypothetical protein AAF560_25195 [Acidobacteriota bacterium]